MAPLVEVGCLFTLSNGSVSPVVVLHVLARIALCLLFHRGPLAPLHDVRDNAVMASDLEAKICVLGAQGVGKTSLLHRYVKGTFDPPSVSSTIGASFLVKKVLDVDSGTTVRLQLWDTAGQERFRAISRLYYRGASAVVLCYSILDEESFLEMGRWLREVKQNLDENVIIHVVGTKADVAEQNSLLRQISLDRCIGFVAENVLRRGQTPPPAQALKPRQVSLPCQTSTPLYPDLSITKRFSPTPMSPLDFGSSSGSRTPGESKSKRSSNFWGLDVSWDCCHEISSSSGEGIEEVFRVITRKLVEQQTARTEAATIEAARLAQCAHQPAGFENRGSFRLKPPDRRRSWLGLTAPGVNIAAKRSWAGETHGTETDDVRRRGCC